MRGREWIAARAARFLKDGDLVNLGIGLPTQVADYIPAGVEVHLQSENGFIDIGPTPDEDEQDPDVVNAGGQPSSILPGGCTFDICMSFGLIRGGHVNTSVLGALQVDQEGSLASWIIPGDRVPGMGGSMDLMAGAKTIIVVTEHCTKDGKSKILKKCTLPLTAFGKVNYVITELGVFHRTEQGFVLEELAPGVTLEEVQDKTVAEFTVSLSSHENLGCGKENEYEL